MSPADAPQTKVRLFSAELPFHVLEVLSEAGVRGSYVYGIQRKLCEQLKADIRLPAVYKVVERLLRGELLESCDGQPKYAGSERVYYRLTAQGKGALAELTKEMETAVIRLNRSIERQRGREGILRKTAEM